VPAGVTSVCVVCVGGGGGGGDAHRNGNGGGGAVRIIWGDRNGSTALFPNNASTL